MSRQRSIVVVGAGDNGRTILNILRLRKMEKRLLGFLDDARTGQVDGYRILGTLDWIKEHPECEYAVGVGTSEARRAIVERLCGLSPRYLSVVHPAAVLASGVKLGRGLLINAGAIVAHNAIIDDFANVNLNCTVGHDCVLEPFVTLGPGINIGGRVVLREGVSVGANATINQSAEIGPWTKVALGAVVMKSFPGGKVLVGNPARVMGFVG